MDLDQGPKKGRELQYGVWWEKGIVQVEREIRMIRQNGSYTKKDGSTAGNGLLWHFKRLQELLWPEKIWHKWNEMELKCYLKYRTIVELGPASSGKTNSAATNCLTDYYCWPECTTVLCCSTTRERLEDRVWGEIKKFHKLAKERFPFLAGNLIEGRQRLVTDGRDSSADGRDFRNGIIGVPCKKGADYVGLGDFIGIKNKRVRLLGDELHLLPRAFVDAISNLDKNPDLKVVGLGNPKETTDALGVLGEPAPDLGGWDSGIDQIPNTKEWRTRRPDGICLQLCGLDSPNLDGKLGIPLITKEAMDRDIAFYGKDSVQFTMMNLGMMPRGQGSRRVLTRQLCIINHAMDEPRWHGPKTKIGFLDAAYRGIGGDRCVFGELNFGPEAETPDESVSQIIHGLVSQNISNPNRKQILALIDLLIVPLKTTAYGAPTGEVEDQIAQFCMNNCKLRNIPPENFFYDSGMRTSLVTSMTRIWSTATNPIDCGGTPSERMVNESIPVKCKDYYSKKITELWYSVRLIIEAQQFRGMTEEVMMEGCSREWRMVGANKIEVETKDEMKQKTGRSPDLFDALAVGVEGARQRGFKIASIVRKRRDTEVDWREDLRAKARHQWQSKELNYAS